MGQDTVEECLWDIGFPFGIPHFQRTLHLYRCDMCKTIVPPKTTSHRVISEIRIREYAPRPKPTKGKNKKRVRDDDGGRGWEAAASQVVCAKCLPAAEARLQEKLDEMGVGADNGIDIRVATPVVEEADPVVA